MKLLQAILAWNLLSKLHAPSGNIEAAKYIINARKALRPAIKDYQDFEQDARATSPDTFQQLIGDEQQRDIQAEMPPLADDTLAALIAANSDTAAGEFDILADV